MTELYDDFLDSIERTLHKHGYPEKRVALPLDRMRQIAADKGLDFDRGLALFRDRGIDHELEPPRVIFHPVQPQPAASTLEDKARAFAEIFQGIDPAEIAALQGLNKFQLFFKVRELAKKLSPEQMTKARQLFEGLSEDEKTDLMKKAQDLGLP